VAPRPARLRRILSAALIALACCLAPCGALAAWAAYDLVDTGRYVTTMAPLAGDPAVRNAVADTVGAGIMDEVDDRLDVRPMRGAVRPYVHDAVHSFTRTKTFRLAWDAANRAVHDAVLRALRDEDERAVTVDLAPVTAQVKQQLTVDHVPFANRIPVEHTAVSVLTAGELDRLRKGFQVLEVAGFWLPVAAAVLAVTGICVATCRRRAVTATGLGTALGGALLALALTLGRRLTLADLPEQAHQPAAAAIYDALTATLRQVSWLLIALGLTVALTAWLTGRYTSRPRRRLAPPAPGAPPGRPAEGTSPAPEVEVEREKRTRGRV
jgi:hypothetical protein